MRAGLLDRRITLQRKTVVQSDSGQEEVTWIDIATVWAQKVELRGNERFTAKQITGNSILTFRVRWSLAVSQVNVEDQIIYKELTYDITDIREIGRHEGLEIDCFTPSEQAVAP